VLLSPRGQSGLEAKILVSASASKFGLGLEALALDLASASNIWPQHGLYLVVLLCRAFFRQKSCKILGILLIFPAIILNRMLSIIGTFFIIIFGLGLGLVALASASAS